MARSKTIKQKKTKIAKTGFIDPNKLKSHPRNYREHPDDQLEHIIKSIRENGFYRNVVVAREDTILAGHGVVKAAIKMKLDSVPFIRLDIDPNDPQALKVLTGDNEISNLVTVDDRELSELLKEIKNIDGLLGTGFDEQQLANLLFITRPKSEIEGMDEASELAGLPEYGGGGNPEFTKIVVSFRNVADRTKFIKLTGAIKATDKTRSI